MEDVQEVTYFDFTDSSEDDQENLSQYEDVFPPESKNDIEGLLYLGKLSETVDVFGHSFVINTLTTGEELAIGLLVRKWEESIGISKALMTATIAASVSAVNGRPFYRSISPAKTQEINDRFTKVLDWYFPVVEALFREYTDLVERQMLAFKALEGKSLRSQ